MNFQSQVKWFALLPSELRAERDQLTSKQILEQVAVTDRNKQCCYISVCFFCSWIFFFFNLKLPFSTDFDYWDYVVPEPNLNEVIFEETTCQSLVKMLENCLSKSKHTKLGCSKVLVPEKLTQRIAQDVLRLSSTEPCGLRGCVMHVNLEIENVCKKLDRIVCDSSVVPTFELTLVFKQENCSWMSFRDFFFSRGRFSSGLRRTLILSSGFRLVKKKLYSLIGTTVIEECWKRSTGKGPFSDWVITLRSAPLKSL